MKVRCIDAGGCSCITAGKVYDSIPEKCNDRYCVIIDDFGEEGSYLWSRFEEVPDVKPGDKVLVGDHGTPCRCHRILDGIYTSGITGDTYYVTADRQLWDKCKKLDEPKRVAKKASEIMKILEEDGYEPTQFGFCKEHETDFAYSMFSECGKDITNSLYDWEDKWVTTED